MLKRGMRELSNVSFVGCVCLCHCACLCCGVPVFVRSIMFFCAHTHTHTRMYRHIATKHNELLKWLIPCADWTKPHNKCETSY